VGVRLLREIKLERHLQYALVSKEPLFSKQKQNIEAKEPYYKGKEPYYRTDEPFCRKWYAIVSKEPYLQSQRALLKKGAVSWRLSSSQHQSKESYYRSQRDLL
jgi:hypothetical protein